MKKFAQFWFKSETDLPEPMEKNFEGLAAKFIYNFHYVENVFEELLLNKKILRFINGIQKENTRVFDVVLAKTTQEDSETILHSGFEGGFQEPNRAIF